jgi:hypothetical protein
MSLRKIVRRILLVIAVLCLLPTAAISGACLLLVGSLGPDGGIKSLGTWAFWSPVIAPILLSSFIGWALLTTFRPWFRGLLVTLVMTPVIWIYWIAAKPWTESDFYVAADFNPLDQKLYFVSTQEALLDDKPPALPSRVKAEMWLERINLDGTKRECLLKLPASSAVNVDGFSYRGTRYYATSRDVQLRFSPAYDKIAMQEYWGGVYVVNLPDKSLHRLTLKPSMEEFRYDHGSPFITWRPDNDHLLLWVTRHKNGGRGIPRDAIVSTPAWHFEPEELWEEPPRFAVDARGRPSYPPAPLRTLLWMGIMGQNLIVYDDPHGVHITPLDLKRLDVDKGRPVPLDACWNIIPGPQSNRWLTSEGDIVDDQLRVLRKLPDLHGGYHAQRTPQAWCNNGIIITDLAVGLVILNPDTGTTRTILSSRFIRRSVPPDERAYKMYRQMNASMQKFHEKLQRMGAERSRQIKQDEVDAGNLADGLDQHDTNTLKRARELLWINNDAYVIAANRMTAANWDRADDLVADYILYGSNYTHQCRVLQRVVSYCPDRFSNTLVQVASDLSIINLRMIETDFPGLMALRTPSAESCLVNIALNYPEIHVQYEALSSLYPLDRALYSQTLQQLSTDKDFMAYYTTLHVKAASAKQ